MLFVVDLLKKCTCWLRHLKNLHTRKLKKLVQSCNKIIWYYCDLGNSNIN